MSNGLDPNLFISPQAYTLSLLSRVGLSYSPLHWGRKDRLQSAAMGMNDDYRMRPSARTHIRMSRIAP
jgi:hypothetical protein